MNSSAQTSRLQNEKITLSLDTNSRLHELKSLETAHNYAGGNGLWRLYYEIGERTQNEICGVDQIAEIERTDNVIQLSYSSLSTERDGELDISLVLRVELKENETHWTAKVENHSADILIKELQYPLVGNLQQDGHSLITSTLGGQRYPDAKKFARSGRRMPYSDEDYLGVLKLLTYPGSMAGMNCYLYDQGKQGIYFGTHDESFRDTVHLWRVLDEELESGFSRHLLLAPGEKVSLEPSVLAPYTGKWTTGADIYSKWVHQTWWKRDRSPSWIQEDAGWQRLIMKHQNGIALYPFDQLPRIFEDGNLAGIHTLFMFAWWPGGMDRMYPEYHPDPELGGEAELIRQIAAFKARGGNVILYSSGRLVDYKSPWAKAHADECSIKKESGNKASDAYLFANRSTYERRYGSTELGPMCLGVTRWIDLLKGIIDQAVAYGCQGVFFDQLGNSEPPCYDPNHNHPVPFHNQSVYKRTILKELRNYARDKDPELAFGIEMFSDVTAQYCDFIHGLYLQSLTPQAGWEENEEKPRYTQFTELTSYTFPDLVVSNRDIRENEDIPRRVNYAFQRGLISDVEIYRCRKTIAEFPEYQTYLGKVNALRTRYPEFFYHGIYRDEVGINWDQTEAEAKCFVNGKQTAVVICQSHLPEVSGTLTVKGAKYQDSDAVGTYTVTPSPDPASVTISLKKHTLAIFLFTR